MVKLIGISFGSAAGLQHIQYVLEDKTPNLLISWSRRRGLNPRPDDYESLETYSIAN